MYILNSFYLLHSYNPSFLEHQYLEKTSLSLFSFVCVLTWSLLGVKKSLGHAQIGLF